MSCEWKNRAVHLFSDCQCRHQAMLEYMMSEGDRFAKSIAAFSEEAVLDTAACDSGKGILEKKWTAVIRLQKKVRSSTIIAGNLNFCCIRC